MVFCTQCGELRQGEQRFCTKCGAPYDPVAEASTTVGLGVPAAVPPPPEPRPPLQAPPHKSGWRLVAMFGVAVIVIAGVIVGLVVAFRHTTSTSTIAGPLPSSQLAPTPDVTSEADTSVATSPTFTRPSTVPPPYNGNSVVSVAPAAGSDPKAPTVVALLTRYFTDINERNFADYFTLYTPEVRSALDQAQVAAGYRSTEVSGGRLTDLSTTGDGRLAATMTFTSTQDAADGPDGQTCTHWKVDFFLENVGAAYLFGAPPSNYQAEHVAC